MAIHALEGESPRTNEATVVDDGWLQLAQLVEQVQRLCTQSRLELEAIPEAAAFQRHPDGAHLLDECELARSIGIGSQKQDDLLLRRVGGMRSIQQDRMVSNGDLESRWMRVIGCKETRGLAMLHQSTCHAL